MTPQQEKRIREVIDRMRAGVWPMPLRPHLIAVNDGWHCFGDTAWARGATMKKAYDNWLSVPAKVKNVC